MTFSGKKFIKFVLLLKWLVRAAFMGEQMLNMSQPALSKSIQELEEGLAAQLFFAVVKA